MRITVQILRRRFTVDEYYRMAQAGIFNEDDRVELIDGEIVEMAPIGSNHAARVDLLNRLFNLGAGEEIIVRVHSPIQLGEHSEPQPDIALLRPRPDFYAGYHPGPEDILLVVEVADTSAVYDREVKVPLYARAGIAETWLVDLAGEAIEVHRQPGPEGYRLCQIVHSGERRALESLPGLALAASSMRVRPGVGNQRGPCCALQQAWHGMGKLPPAMGPHAQDVSVTDVRCVL